MFDALDHHYSFLIKALTEGRVIPFFGAGVNLCGRPAGEGWQRGCEYLPSGNELAEHLAATFKYPGTDKHDLVRVSQYAAIMAGLGPLYLELRSLFDADYAPTPLHRFFATLPAILREKGFSPGHQFIVTTNYDDVMERAFDEAGEPYDLLAYMTEDKQQRGKFLHWPPGGKAIPIIKPNKYRDLSLGNHSVILKLNGAIDRQNAEHDSFVITEDNYIEYLSRTDMFSLIPVTLAARMKHSHFLFLGYGLRDWNLRVILHRMWGEQKLIWKSWAIQLNPHALDKKFWGERNVDIFDISLDDYIYGLNKRVQALQHEPL